MYLVCSFCFRSENEYSSILFYKERLRLYKRFLVLVHVHCRDFNIFSSHGLLPYDLVAQSVERRRSNPKVVGSIPTLVRVFLCPCVGPFPSVGLTLTWFIWDRNLALDITLYSVNSSCFMLMLHYGDMY